MKTKLKGKQTDSTVQHFPFRCCQVWVIRSIKHTEESPLLLEIWSQSLHVYKFIRNLQAFPDKHNRSFKISGSESLKRIPSGFHPDFSLSRDTTASAAICVDSDKQPWWIGFPCEQLPQFASIMQWQKDTLSLTCCCAEFIKD